MTVEELIDELEGLENSEVRLLVDLDTIEVKDIQYDCELGIAYIIGNCE